MASVSEVCHLTCHLELIGVSVWEMSLLCPGLVCRLTYLLCHPKPWDFLSPGRAFTRLLSGVFLRYHLWPKIRSNKYQFSHILYPTETCPALPLPVFFCSFLVTGNRDQAPAPVTQVPRMYWNTVPWVKASQCSPLFHVVSSLEKQQSPFAYLLHMKHIQCFTVTFQNMLWWMCCMYRHWAGSSICKAM